MAQQAEWYVMRVISGQEKKIKSYIETEIVREKLDKYVPQVVIPKEKVYEIRNGKKNVRERNKLPGYVLIQADLKTNAEVMPLIDSIPGIIGFLGSEGGKRAVNELPVPLRDNEIKRFLGSDDPLEEEASVENQYMVGETIKVIDGAFNGFTGTIEEVFEDRKKLNVMVKIFGRNTPLELNYTQVEKES